MTFDRMQYFPVNFIDHGKTSDDWDRESKLSEKMKLSQDKK